MSKWVAFTCRRQRCGQSRSLTDVKVSENGFSNSIYGARGRVSVVVRYRCLDVLSYRMIRWLARGVLRVESGSVLSAREDPPGKTAHSTERNSRHQKSDSVA